MRPLLERIESLPWPKNSKSDTDMIPISMVPRRIREALPHPSPYNRTWSAEYEYELTHRYFWRTRVSHFLQRQAELVDSLQPLLEACRAGVTKSVVDDESGYPSS